MPPRLSALFLFATLAMRRGLVLAMIAAAACGETSALGQPCASDGACDSGFCATAICRAPDADDDSDGLSNTDERTLGLRLDAPDTDGDGRGDGMEAGSGPTDTDLDGIIDALESASGDADADCLPDELDPAGAAAPASSDQLVARFCSSVGVCATAVRTATCVAGRPECGVESADFEADEHRCDGLDNDCDGRVDEASRWQGTPVGASCTMPGRCGVGVVECAAPDTAVCSTGPGGRADARQPEWCNGVDDDCDGEIDEALSPDGIIGSACPGLGFCLDGHLECADGAVRCSSAPGGSTWTGMDEVCNGLDDDCDGTADNGFTLDGTPLGGDCGQGSCAGGEVACAPNGDSAVCSTDALAEPEACNDLDDDCDGLTDEAADLDVVEAGCPTSGVCGAKGAVVAACVGSWQCAPAPGSPWQPSTESLCDGLDNDCDGTTDEAFGFVVDGTSLSVGAPCGSGACAGGHVVCGADGVAAVCSTAVLAADEQCNGLDDDCDGLVDEALLYAGQPLGAPCSGRGQCGPGVVECAPTGAPVCSSNPDGSASTAKPEQCNGLDDDCDGKIDDLADVVATTATCPAAGICDAVAPVIGCAGGQLVCDFSVVPGYEPKEASCDQLDNDCDRLVDERLPKRPRVLTQVTPGLPSPRRRTAVVSAEDALWVIGGEPSSADATAPVGRQAWHYSPVAGWGRAPDLPGPDRRGAAAVELEEAVLVFGGMGPLGEAIGPIARYSEGAWTELAPAGLAGARVDHVAIASREADDGDGAVWLIGGTSLGAPSPVAALGVASGSWLPAIPSGPGWLVGAAGALLPTADSPQGGRIVVYGGREDTSPMSSRTWILDIAAGGWTPLDLVGPGPRQGHSLLTLPDGRVLLGGGVGESGAPASDVWVLDPAAAGWQPVALDLPSVDGGHLALLGKTLVWVGLGDSGASRAWTLDAYGFGSAPMAWATVTTGLVPGPRVGPALVVRSDGSAWLFGGRRPSEAGDLPITDTWTRSPTGEWAEDTRPGAPVRLGFAAAYSPSLDKLWVHGGRTPAGALSSAVFTYDASGWHSTASISPAAADHAIAFDDAGKRLLVAAGVGSATTVYSVPLPSGTSSPLATHGEAPPRLTRPSLFVTEDGTIAFLGGGPEAQGAVWSLSLEDLGWTRLGEPPVTGDAPPVLVYEPGSSRVIQISGTTAAVFGLDAPPFAIALTSTASAVPPTTAGVAFDPLRSHAWLVGGAEADGAATSAIWQLDFECEPP